MNGRSKRKITVGPFSRTNPRATAWSTLRHSLLVGVVGAGLYLLATAWAPHLKENMWLGLCLWIALCMFVGGLWEWQVGEGD